METFSALPAPCEGNPPVAGGFPSQNASDTELWCFLWSAPWINVGANNSEASDLRRHRPHYDAIVLKFILCWGLFHLICAHHVYRGPINSEGFLNDMSKTHDDVIKWKQFPRYWPLVREIHRSPIDSPHKCQWRGALMFSLICAWMHGWANNRDGDHLRRPRAHYDITVMTVRHLTPTKHNHAQIVQRVLGWIVSVCVATRRKIPARFHHDCHHDMERCPSLLDICDGNPPIWSVDFLHKGPVMWKTFHGSLTRYVKLRVAHAPGMPGTFSPAAYFKGNR